MNQLGKVVKSTGSEITVKFDSGERRICKVRGSFRIKSIKSTNPVAVGDRVEVLINENDPIGIIVDIHERKNYIVRKSINLSHQLHIIAVNIDTAFIVTTLADPFTTPGFIDRFLVTCEAYHIQAIIVVNKCDQFNEKAIKELEKRRKIYTDVGYEILVTSATTGEGLAELKALMRNKTSLFSGHSGVGKSSLINALYPNFNLRVGEISSKHNKGTHTTTFAEMLELDENTYIIDSPGIKELGLFNMQKEEIGHYFPEINKVSEGCKFSNCMHVNEPGCAVMKATEEGSIAEERYQSYLNMINSDEIVSKPYDK